MQVAVKNSGGSPVLDVFLLNLPKSIRRVFHREEKPNEFF